MQHNRHFGASHSTKIPHKMPSKAPDLSLPLGFRTRQRASLHQKSRWAHSLDCGSINTSNSFEPARLINLELLNWQRSESLNNKTYHAQMVQFNMQLLECSLVKSVDHTLFFLALTAPVDNTRVQVKEPKSRSQHNENRQQTGVPGKPFRYTNIGGLSSQNNFLTWAKITTSAARVFPLLEGHYYSYL